jgi:hypothetical protein
VRQFGFVEFSYLATVLGDFAQYFGKTVGIVKAISFSRSLLGAHLLFDDSFLVLRLGPHAILSSIVRCV